MRRALSLCGGMGSAKLIFDMLGEDIEVWEVEIDEHARKLADHNVKVKRPCNDLRDIGARQMLMEWPAFDFVVFGFTCKSLSVQSNGDDLNGSSGILFDCMNILSLAKYRNPDVKFMIENVASMTNEMKKVITGIIGVDYIRINSSLTSGQARDRLYWANFPVEIPEDRKIKANSVLESDAVELKAWSKSTRYKDENGKVHSSPAPDRISYIEDRYRIDGKANTLVMGRGCRGPSTENIIINSDGTKRCLTVRECARLQSLPDSFDFSVISNPQAYNCIGSGWEIEAVKHIFKRMIS